ncbi:MAG: type II secretion system protein [Candidatus Omnitrophota bacterium]
MIKMRKAFTLVELMTVLAIVGLVTAISLPNLLQARMRANEVAAQTTLKAINIALKNYYIAQTPPRFPTSLSALSTAKPSYLASQIVSSSVSGPVIPLNPSTFKGYYFRYETASVSGGRAFSYKLAALPKTEGITGSRYFFVDPLGVVVETTNENATAPLMVTPESLCTAAAPLPPPLNPTD